MSRDLGRAYCLPDATGAPCAATPPLRSFRCRILGPDAGEDELLLREGSRHGGLKREWWDDFFVELLRYSTEAVPLRSSPRRSRRLSDKDRDRRPTRGRRRPQRRRRRPTRRRRRPPRQRRRLTRGRRPTRRQRRPPRRRKRPTRRRRRRASSAWVRSPERGQRISCCLR